MIRTATRTAPTPRRARAASTAALLLVALGAALVADGARAVVHDRLPGDDLGGASTLPAARVIGEDGGAPLHGSVPAERPAAPAGTAPAPIA